jgi:hypothetical protein
MAATTLGVLLGAKTALDVAGSIRSGNAARAQGEYEGAALDQNARLEDLRAADAIARGHEASLRQRTATQGAVGDVRASLGAQGVDLGVGSAADVQSETQHMGELDRITIENNARREAWGFNVAAADYRNQANLARLGGKNTAAARRLEAGSTLLTAGTNFYGATRKG